MTSTRAAKKATAPAPAAKKATGRKTTTGARPATKRTTTHKANTNPPKLSLVKPRKPLPVRDLPFMTDTQGYATLAACIVGIHTPNIRDWRDHRDNTATRHLRDGSTLHYNLTTRTLTWQAACRMGATHEYILATPSGACAARLHADACTQLHADLTLIPRLTADELEALGLLQTPTWARKDLLGEAPTVSIPVDDEPITQAIASAADTQPMSTQAIADHIAERLAADTPKEYPQP